MCVYPLILFILAHPPSPCSSFNIALSLSFPIIHSYSPVPIHSLLLVFFVFTSSALTLPIFTHNLFIPSNLSIYSRFVYFFLPSISVICNTPFSAVFALHIPEIVSRAVGVGDLTPCGCCVIANRLPLAAHYAVV